jgi:hypothetical protein
MSTTVETAFTVFTLRLIRGHVNGMAEIKIAADFAARDASPAEWRSEVFCF